MNVAQRVSARDRRRLERMRRIVGRLMDAADEAQNNLERHEVDWFAVNTRGMISAARHLCRFRQRLTRRRPRKEVHHA